MKWRAFVLLALALLLPCRVASAQVTVDAFATFNATTTTLTWNHTTAAQSNRAMVVTCAATTDTFVSITYSGVAMTSSGSNNDATDAVTFATYYLAAPATGSNNVVATFSSNTANKRCTSGTYYGVDQATPVGALVFDADPGGVTTGDNHNVTCPANSIVWEAIYIRPAATSLAVLAGQTQRSSDTGFQTMTSTKAGAGTTNVGHTWIASFSHHLENSLCVNELVATTPRSLMLLGVQ